MNYIFQKGDDCKSYLPYKSLVLSQNDFQPYLKTLENSYEILNYSNSLFQHQLRGLSAKSGQTDPLFSAETDPLFLV